MPTRSRGLGVSWTGLDGVLDGAELGGGGGGAETLGLGGAVGGAVWVTGIGGGVLPTCIEDIKRTSLWRVVNREGKQGQ